MEVRGVITASNIARANNYIAFDIRPASISGRSIELCVISRRSRHRAGTRYFRRGIDHDGNVANYNETEQLLLIRGTSGKTEDKFSFVQIRGSVPVFWAEINTLRYKPDLQVMDLGGTVSTFSFIICSVSSCSIKADAMEAHFKQQLKVYGDLTLVSLVNNKGHELPVKLSYERWISHVSLDGICSSMMLKLKHRFNCPTSNIPISISITNASICDGTV